MDEINQIRVEAAALYVVVQINRRTPPPGPRVTPLSNEFLPPKHFLLLGNSPGGMLSNARDLHGNKPPNDLGSVDCTSVDPPGLCWKTTSGPGLFRAICAFRRQGHFRRHFPFCSHVRPQITHVFYSIRFALSLDVKRRLNL